MLIWGQSTDSLKAQIEVHKDYSTMKQQQNPILLLKAIKGITHTYKAQVHPVHTLHVSRRSFYHLHQGNDTVPEYYERFKTSVEVLEEMLDNLGADEMLMQYICATKDIGHDNITVAEKMKHAKEGRDIYLAVAYILGLDQRHFGAIQQGATE